MIGRSLAHYEILAKVGEGGMGAVYKARDTRLDRLVAIKILSPATVLDPERKRRFAQEARAASALNHPNIVTIHDIDTVDGVNFIAMEYVQGKTLAELIGRKGLGLSTTLNYAIQAAAALSKAHRAGIIHRDLKPANIMVTDDGLVKILDFGVAKLTAEVGGSSDAHTRTFEDLPRTEDGKIVGTVAYMSPEQAEGKPLDARSDIFSFGSVLYEMVTGTRTFQEATSASTMAAVLNKEPRPPSQLATDLPRDLERIILRCLRKDPARRVQVMADLVVELEEIRTESGSQIAAAERPARTRRVHTGRWLLASATSVLLLAAGTWIFWPRPAAPLPPMRLLPLTTLPGDERLPTFSPDGNQVAFTWTGEQRDNVDIYIKPLGPGTPLRLTFDPADDLAPAWSPDGSLIAFVRRQGDQAAIYLVTPPFQRSERRLTDFHPTSVVSTLLDPGQWQQLTTISWFPDGKWLAVAAQDAAGQMNGIVAIPVEGGEPRRLIWEPLSVARYHFPVVSPTGAFLAYAACKTGVDCVVNVVALAGVATRGTPQPLASDVHHGIAWGPGGQSVIYPKRGTGYLERVPISGGSPERIELAGTPGNEPVTSRTGDTLAFARRIDAYDIWKFEGGGTAGPDTFVPLSSTLSDIAPDFSPDGKRVVFASKRSGQGEQIWVGNFDGTNVISVTPITGRGQGMPRWSPDGHSIAYDATGEDGIPHIYVVNADGGKSQRLTQSQGDERIPSWSRDGKAVYFGSNRSGTWEIYRVPVSGGEPVQMTDNKVRGRQRPQFASAWESSDGKILYYTTDGALFSKALPDGPEVPIPVSVSWWNFFPTKEGIYYTVTPDPRAHPVAHELRFFDFAKATSHVLNRFESVGTGGLSVSPDGKTVLTSGRKTSAGFDLMLIQNYR